jgi:hypothetical protein
MAVEVEAGAEPELEQPVLVDEDLVFAVDEYLEEELARLDGLADLTEPLPEPEPPPALELDSAITQDDSSAETAEPGLDTALQEYPEMVQVHVVVPPPLEPDEDVPCDMKQAQVQTREVRGTTDVLNVYLADKVAVRRGQTPEGWEQPPMAAYEQLDVPRSLIPGRMEHLPDQ